MILTITQNRKVLVINRFNSYRILSPKVGCQIDTKGNMRKVEVHTVKNDSATVVDSKQEPDSSEYSLDP